MKLERSAKANICCAVVFVMILAVVYLLFLTPLYAINDDSAMANISYGVFGTYSNRLIFVNICLGSFIKQLMQLFPHIPWYAVCEVIVILASFIVLFFLLLEQFGIGGGRISCNSRDSIFWVQLYCTDTIFADSRDCLHCGMFIPFLWNSSKENLGSFNFWRSNFCGKFVSI